MKKFLSLSLLFLFWGASMAYAQKTKSASGQWIKISEDEIVTISYNSKITKDKQGNHIVWVKAVYHDSEWQRYFADQIGSSVPVITTKTKAKFDDIYSYVMVRQVLCYNRAGKLIFDTGDDSSAGWGPVNASDPVGIVGEYLDNLRRKP